MISLVEVAEPVAGIFLTGVTKWGLPSFRAQFYAANQAMPGLKGGFHVAAGTLVPVPQIGFADAAIHATRGDQDRWNVCFQCQAVIPILVLQNINRCRPGR